VSLWVFLAAAVLLSFERICYLWIWHAPEAFRDLCARPPIASLGEPVDVLRLLFYGFKLLQCAVFIGWCYFFGNGSLLPFSGNLLSLGLGTALIVAGQTLNASVFYRLGKLGVFYGDRFGYQIPWCRKFPFSLCEHPQYAGALLSIWGFFLFMRFPADDWYLLPLLETAYYTVGAYFER
jgi:methylene-fatty-acyl-phospholipid synthase